MKKRKKEYFGKYNGIKKIRESREERQHDLIQTLNVLEDIGKSAHTNLNVEQRINGVATAHVDTSLSLNGGQDGTL